MNNEKNKQIINTFLVYGFVGFLIEICVFLSWTGVLPSMKKLLIVAIIPYILLFILVMIKPTRVFLWNIYAKVKETCVEMLEKCRQANWKKNFLFAFGNVIASTVVGVLIFGIEWRKIAFLFTVTSVISLFVIYHNSFTKKIEITVFALIMIIGSLYAITLPISCGISWDDEAHFCTSLLLSHVFDGRISGADREVLNGFISTALEHNLYTRDTHEVWVQKINEIHASGAFEVVGRMMPKLEHVCYFPSLIGLFIGRVLHLPYNVIFILGKLTNLFAYASLVYFSMKKLKYGKMIVATVAMTPTCLFMAASYARDPWMIGFIMLGFCTLVGEIQRPEKKLSCLDLISIIVFFVLGTIPKAIYGPILLTAICMPKEKFASEKQMKMFRVAVIIALLAVLATFVLPYIASSGTAVQDDRGGSDVNAGMQTMYILSEPLTYAKNLFKFFEGYFSFEKAREYLSHMHYFGNTGYTTLLQVLLAVVMFTDHGKDEVTLKWPLKIMTLFMSFGTLCLAATAMYVAFTPVYLDTINGCQTRYMLQILLPTVFVLGNVKIDNRMNTKAYRMIILGIFAFILIKAIWTLFISTY